MAWTPRESASSPSAVIDTFDALTPVASTYSATVNMPCNNVLGAAIIPIQGLGPFVQGGAGVASGGGISAISQAFVSNNIAGNIIIVDFSCAATFPLLNATCTDSQGNIYVALEFGHVGGAADFIGSFIAFNVTPGANTVTVTFTGTGAPVNTAAIAIHEYGGAPNVGFTTWNASTLYVVGQVVLGGSAAQICIHGGTSGGSTPTWNTNVGQTTNDGGTVVWRCVSQVIAAGFQVGIGNITLSVQVGSGVTIHLFYSYAPCGTPALPLPGPSGGPLIPAAWYVTYEVTGSPAVGGYVDRSSYLFLGQGAQHDFNLQVRQRGQATYTLVVRYGDPYTPTQFQPVFFFDQTSAGYTLMYAGVLLDFTARQIAVNGDRYYDCSATTLEALLDTVYVTTPMSFQNSSCGAIFTALFNAFESGASISLGTVQAGVVIPLFNAQIGDKLSGLADQLATTSQFIWGVNPQTGALYFQAPTTTAAPFSLTSSQALWDTISNKLEGVDFRNRQGVRLSYDAFPHSMEYIVGAGQTNITLMRPVKQLVAGYITLSTPNHATASFSGQPSIGDTVTIGPATGSWQGGHIYSLGGVIVVNGFVQTVTNAGTSGSSQPNFSTVTGATTTDNSVIWTCQGPLGIGTGASIYEFVASIDNTQYGQVLIDSTLAGTVQNLVDAINANATTRGTKFSLPTWENSQVNAITVTGTGFTVQQKAAGSGWVAGLSASSTAFSWSAANTSGGTSPQGSLGPNQGATITIQVYQQGTSTASPGVSYTEGSAVISMATPLNAGASLNIEYTRMDGDVIQVERSDLVAALAVTMNGTGKIQQFTDQSQQGLISTNALAGLQLAQQALAAYDVPPTEIEIDVLQPGLLPGQLLTIALTGYWSIINGTYFIEEVRAKLVPVWPWMDSPPAPGAGHYRYTIKIVNTAQIGDYMQFWTGRGGGAIGSGAGGGGLVATSGGAVATQGVQPPIATLTSLGIVEPDGTTITINSQGIISATSSASGSSSKYTTSWTSQTSVTVTHNLGTKAVLVQVYDASGNLVIPQGIDITSTSALTLTFGAAFTGSVVVIGFAGTVTVNNFTQSWSAQTSVTVNHNLGTTSVFVQVTDASGNIVIPQNVQATNANNVVLTFGAAFTGSVIVASIATPPRQFNASWSSQTSVTITHNLGTTAVIVTVYDTSGNKVIPQNVQATDANNVVLTFGASFSGSASVMG